ncbi:hypothetical protein ACQ4PT_054294 [Festuca glaucescens]
MSSEDSLKSLSLDYLNLLINGQAFSDVAFSVEGRLVHAHRCVLAARSLFFRKLFCGLDPSHQPPPPPLNWPTSAGAGGGGGGSRGGGGGGAPAAPELVIPVSSIRYEVLVLVLQFLYSGQASVAAPKSGPLPGCGARGCWHTRCGAAVDLALDTLSAARSFGVEQLALLVQVGEQKPYCCYHSNLHPSICTPPFFLGICKHMLTRSPVVDAIKVDGR